MLAKTDQLVWMDMEMTGLDPDSDRVLEIAVLITDGSLNILSEGPALVLHQSDAVLSAMDEWNATHHTASGLVDRVRRSTVDEAQAQERILAFLREYVPPSAAPLCGNTIWQDRRFLVRHLPEVEKYLHYRNVDVSTVKELVHRWYPELPRFSKAKGHTALADIRESIAELRYYRERVFCAVL